MCCHYYGELFQTQQEYMSGYYTGPFLNQIKGHYTVLYNYDCISETDTVATQKCGKTVAQLKFICS